MLRRASSRTRTCARTFGPNLRANPCANQCGFTLIESVVASALTIATLAGVTQLFLQAAWMTADARRAPIALAAAESKLEQLLALSWTYDASGAALSDERSDTSVDPPSAAGGAGLTVSPADSLSRASPGYVDYLDIYGHSLGSAPASGAIFGRRWLIQPLPAAPLDVRILRVCVLRLSGSGADPPPEVCLATLRTRR
jgi:hypothetical protein